LEYLEFLFLKTLTQVHLRAAFKAVYGGLCYF